MSARSQPQSICFSSVLIIDPFSEKIGIIVFITIDQLYIKINGGETECFPIINQTLIDIDIGINVL